MAKKKVEKEDGELSDMISDIVKKYGNIIKPASEILEEKLEVFSTGSPNLDLALGGGIQEGSMIEVVGLPKVGKTSLCLQTLTSYMDKGRACYFFDSENRFDKKNLQIRGMRAEKLNLIRSEEDKILDANDTLNLIEQIMKKEKGCAIVLDSLSTLLSRERATSEVDAQRRDTRPKLYSDWLQGISPLIRINKISLFIIRHFGTNVTGQGKKYIPDGGLKVEFRKDISLHCAWSEKWMHGEKYLGKIMHFDILCSNFAAPIDKIDTYLRFGYGIDREKEVVSQGLDFGLLERSGSWILLSFLQEPIKLQGEERVIEYLRENPESYTLLATKIKEALS